MTSTGMKSERGPLWKLLATIFVTTVLLNYPWELVQSPLYVGMDSFSLMWWHCLLAALGDGPLVLLIFITGWAALGRRDWFVRPGVSGYGLMLVAGLVIGVSVEWVAVYLVREWVYTARMPLVPGLGVGLTPVAQMLVLPPLIFRAVARWQDRVGYADRL